jgi:5-methylcytosine-specific restriction enzyme subunit McrC
MTRVRRTHTQLLGPILCHVLRAGAARYPRRTGQLQVLDQTTRQLGVGGKVPISPDLEFRLEDETVFVGDVTYKLSPSGQARSADYFQLLSYCTVLGLREGVLIYAQVDDGEPDRHIYRLDLQGTRADIEASVASLANWITSRAATPVEPRPLATASR